MRGPTSALIVLSILAVSGIPPGHASPEADYAHRFDWSAPADHVGDLLVQVHLDYGIDNACSIYFGAAGRYQGVGIDYATMVSGGGSGVSYGGNLVHLHAGPVDTRAVTSTGGGRWGVETWFAGTGFTGERTLTWAVFDAQQWQMRTETIDPFTIDIACHDPFDVLRLSGSRSVIGFMHEDMDGAGASVNTVFGPQAAVNVQDGLTANITEQAVLFATRGVTFGGMSDTTVTLRHPDGTDVYAFGPENPDIDFVGVPGAYDVRVDRIAAAHYQNFWGILGGLDTVGDLDEILG